VAADDLPLGAMGGGGAVGMQNQLPAPAVNTDIVVELAAQDTPADGGIAAVFLVMQVVSVAVGGGAIAARLRAFPVAEQDGLADVPRDAVRPADVQRQRRLVPRCFKELGTQVGGQPGRA